MCYLKHSIISGPTLGEAPAFPRPPNFLKKRKKEKEKKRNTHFQIKGIFDGIRIFDWQTSPRHPN